MRRVAVVILMLCMIPQLLKADIIVTKDNNRYTGKVVKILPKDFAVKLNDGTVIIIPKNKVSQIIRNNIVLDLDQGIRYFVEKRRPFLPFLILGTATGIYSFKKFKDYKDHKKQADDLAAQAGMQEGYQNLNDQSKRDLAYGIVSAIFSVGSYYISLKPMEVKVPMGKINLSASPRGINLALHF